MLHLTCPIRTTDDFLNNVFCISGQPGPYVGSLSVRSAANIFHYSLREKKQQKKNKSHQTPATAAPSSEVNINFCCCPAQMRRSGCWHLRQKGCRAASAFITCCHTKKKFLQSFATGVVLNHSSTALSLNCCCGGVFFVDN